MSQVRTLHRLIAPAVEALWFELVSCEVFRRCTTMIFQVFVDKPGGIGLDECAEVSRQISAVLDVEDPINGRLNFRGFVTGLRAAIVYDEPLSPLSEARQRSVCESRERDNGSFGE